MRTLDRYIIRQLIAPIIFCSMTLVLLVLFADVFDRLNDMIKHQTSAYDILRYYLALTPFTFVQVIPWASFLGIIYVLTTLNHHNELLAMKTAGVRITKIAAPMLFVGFFIGVITFIINDRMVPETFLRAQQILEDKIEAKRIESDQKILSDVTYFGENQQLYYIRFLNKEKNSLDGIILLSLDKDRRVREKTVAEYAVKENGVWVFYNVSTYSMDRKGRLLGEPKIVDKLPMPRMKENFEDFVKAAKEGEFLSYKELKYYVKHLEKTGLKVSAQRVTMHHKLAFPWNSLVMMLVTIPLLSKTLTRRGVALTVLQCLAIVFGYHALGAITLALGKSGAIPPFLSAWLASILFASVAIAFLERANY